jgi:hypothetical protein
VTGDLLDVDLHFSDGPADREWVVVEIFGLDPEQVRLKAGKSAEANDQQQDSAKSEAHLRTDIQVFQFHGSDSINLLSAENCRECGHSSGFAEPQGEMSSERGRKRKNDPEVIWRQIPAADLRTAIRPFFLVLPWCGGNCIRSFLRQTRMTLV